MQRVTAVTTLFGYSIVAAGPASKHLKKAVDCNSDAQGAMKKQSAANNAPISKQTLQKNQEAPCVSGAAAAASLAQARLPAGRSICRRCDSQQQPTKRGERGG
jgi:hypothetical protein